MNTPFYPQQSAFDRDSRYNPQGDMTNNLDPKSDQHREIMVYDPIDTQRMVNERFMTSNQLMTNIPQRAISIKEDRTPRSNDHSFEALIEKGQNVFTAICELFFSIFCFCIHFIVDYTDRQHREQRLINSQMHQNSSDPIFDPNHPQHYRIYQQNLNNASGQDYTRGENVHSNLSTNRAPRNVSSGALNYQDLKQPQQMYQGFAEPYDGLLHSRGALEPTRDWKYLNAQANQSPNYYYEQNAYYRPDSHQPATKSEQFFAAPNRDASMEDNRGKENSPDFAGGRTSYRFKSYNLEIFGKPGLRL